MVIPILFVCTLLRAQCPATTCADSLAYTVTKDTLIVSANYSSPVWRVATGPGVISGNNVVGLKPGTTTVLLLQANEGNTMTISYKVVTVAPVPPPIIPALRITGVTIVNGHIQFTFWDGAVQSL